jgi:hypothetical protein
MRSMNNCMNNPLPGRQRSRHDIFEATMPVCWQAPLFRLRMYRGRVASAVLIGVDLGPNLSVTGSLATILWLSALRRENQEVRAWSFLKLGTLVMSPALLLAIAGLLVAGSVHSF